MDNQKTGTAKWYTKQCLFKVIELLRTYDQYQDWTIGSFIMTLHQFTVKKAAPII